MNSQLIEFLIIIFLGIVAAAGIFCYGGFDAIKEAIQEATGKIREIISLPRNIWIRKKYRERKTKEFIELHKAEIIERLMKESELLLSIKNDYRRREEQGERGEWKEKFMDRFTKIN